MANWILRILETPQEMTAVEILQRQVWPGNDLEVVPAHMLLAIAHNGGLVIGAYAAPDAETKADAYAAFFGTGDEAEDAPGSGLDPGWSHAAGPARTELPGTDLLGFVLGFPGFYYTPDGPRAKHHSHMLGVHPQSRDQGIGFALKRAQWQMVRRQGIDRITWTFDPLFSRNAFLNISRLGAVCNTYLRDEYGEMRDGLNVGLPSDRFQVDWWVNSQRVFRRLSKRARLQLDLAHFLAAGALITNPSQPGANGLPRPGPVGIPEPGELPRQAAPGEENGNLFPLLLVEIPADLLAMKAADPALALEWRLHTQSLFEDLFQRGFLVTDFVYLPGAQARSFYVLSHGESTL